MLGQPTRFDGSDDFEHDFSEPPSLDSITTRCACGVRMTGQFEEGTTVVTCPWCRRSERMTVAQALPPREPGEPKS